MNNRNRYKNILDEKIVRQKNQVQVDSETNTIFLYDEIGWNYGERFHQCIKPNRPRQAVNGRNQFSWRRHF